MSTKTVSGTTSSTLRAAKARIQAEAEAQATRIEWMIQNLLALPAPTETEAP